jgi:hypothetical protein
MGRINCILKFNNCYLVFIQYSMIYFNIGYIIDHIFQTSSQSGYITGQFDINYHISLIIILPLITLFLLANILTECKLTIIVTFNVNFLFYIISSRLSVGGQAWIVYIKLTSNISWLGRCLENMVNNITYIKINHWILYKY